MRKRIKKDWQKHKIWAISVGLLVANLFIFLPHFLPSHALNTNIYASNCLGDWFGPDRAIGAPEISATGSFAQFSSENSAFYKTGFQSIICQNFDDTELKDGHKFISARLGLSLAVDEILDENNPIESSSSSVEIIKQENENNEDQTQEQETELVPKNEEPATPISILPLSLKNLISFNPVFAQEGSQSNNNSELTIISPELIQEGENLINEDQPQSDSNQSLEGTEENQPAEQEVILDLPTEETNSLPSIVTEESNSTSTQAVVDSQADAIFNIRHSLEDNNYQVETFSSYPASPALHGGYFYFDLPEIKSFDDLEKLKISLEGLLGGDQRLITYLDSLWVEVTYEDNFEITPPTLEMEKNSWRSDEEPIIKIKSRNVNLIKKDNFKKSAIKKLNILSTEPEIFVSLVDAANKEIDLKLEKDFQLEELDGFSQIKILRPRSFKPGHYKLKYKIEQNGEKAEAEYDFQWGVLAINTNKSVYLPNEDAYLQMAALNDLGNTLCDANLKLSVFNEASGQESIFTTADKTIEKSGKCGANNVIDVPDYFIHYQTDAEGKYELTLTNLDNSYEIKDSFEVRSAVAFEVERIGPTRIYPLVNYQMSLIIKPNKDFTGLITEKIPSSFKIVSVDLENSGQATISSPIDDQQDKEKIINFLEKKKNSWNEQSAEEKNLSWQVDWQAGQTYELKYEFDAPDISPYFYLLGPLEIGDWQEVRNWQIASDAIVFVQTAYGTGTGVASATFANGVTVNNMMIAVCSASKIGQLSIANFSTAIDQSVPVPAVPPVQAIFYKVATILDTGAVAVSCTSTAGTAIVGLHIYEYRGLATSLSTDGTGSNVGSGTDPDSGIVVTTNADDLLIAGVVYLANVNGFSSWSNSFTERNDFRDLVNSVSFGGAERIVNAAGPYTTRAARGFPVLGAWRGQIAAFKKASGITVYGTIYSDEGITPFDCAMLGPPYLTVTLKVNGLGSYSGPCITSQGTFAIPGVVINNPDDAVTAYIDGASQKGVVITKAADTTSDINLNIYQDRAILRHEGAAVIANVDIAQYDKDQDPDIHLDSDLDPGNGTYALIVDNDTELHIWTGKNFTSGGVVTTSPGGAAPGGDLHLDDNAVFNSSDAISIGGNWTADLGTTFTHNNNDVTFTATATGKTIVANSQNFYNVIFNGSGGGWSFSDSSTTISNDLTMTAGTLSGTQNIYVNGGDVTGDGSINLTGGDFILDGDGNFGGATAWTFYTLKIGDGSGSTLTTTTGAGGVTVSNVLFIGANQTLDAGSKIWTLSGATGIPFIIAGFFTPNASTFTYAGNNLVGNTIITVTTYNNLTVNNGSETYVLAGTTNLNGDLTITAGTLDVTASNHALNVKGSWANSGTFNSEQGTVIFNGISNGKTINAGSSAFYNLTFNGTGGEWTLSSSNLDVNASLNITKGTLIASTLNIKLAQSLTIANGGYFTKGSGTFTFDGNGATPGVLVWSDANSTKQDMGTVVVDGINTFSIGLGSSVKCTKLTVGADDALNLGVSGYTLTLTGSGIGVSKPLTINTGAIFTVGNSTIEYTGDNTTEVTFLTSAITGDYYNLKINGVGPFNGEAGSWIINNNLDVTSGTFNLGGPTIITNDLFISGTLDVVFSQNYPLTVTGSWTNTAGSFNARAGLVTFNSAGSETITTNSQPFYQLTFVGSGSWALQDVLDVNNTFTLNGGTLTQAANANINFGGHTTFALSTVFTKASGTGKVIFDGSDAKFTDNTVVKQNLGKVKVGASPDDVTLCSNSTMDSLEVSGGDTYYLNDWAIDVTNSIMVNSTGTLDANTDRSALCPSGAGALINLETDWTVDSDGAFLAGSSTVTFDGPADRSSNIDSGGTDDNHDFYNFVFARAHVAIGTTSSLTNNLKVSNNFNLSTLDSFLDSGNRSINVGGNWANSGYFGAGFGTVTFDAGSTGKTIDSGGTGAGKDFYNIVFNNSAGGWTIQNNNLTANNNFSITDTAASSGFIVEANRTITVKGNFTNNEGGATTTWNSGTILNLTKTGGGSYTINTKTTGADVYTTLQVGANTDIRMWNSSASTYSVNSSGSLYSMDHAATDGDLYIWGDYHTTSGNTDYWNYANDFDGTALGGSSRQVKVYINVDGVADDNITVDSSGILNVIGGGSVSGDITIVGQGTGDLWDFDCTGTCNVQESTWNYLNLTGGTLTLLNSTLNNEDAPDAGTLNIDWYLGDYVVNRANLGPIDTGANDIIISENSSTPASTVFKWTGGTGGSWGSGSAQQTTGTDSAGVIPYPGSATDGAVRVREYARTSGGYTFYKYNLHINWQGANYGEYDYYNGYGQNYITSTLNSSSGEDECISESWQRNTIAQNNAIPAIDEPPTNGTWYNGMISGLNITIDDYSIDFGSLTPGGNPTDQTNTITVSTSASNGYVVYLWSTQAMTSDLATINDWPGTNNVPTTWNSGSYGFGYSTNDYDLTGGTADRFSGPKFAGFIHDNTGGQPVIDRTGPSAAETNIITYRIAASAIQPAGSYQTNIVYVIVPNY